MSTSKPQLIRWYATSCGLLLIPALIWNAAMTDQLPPAYAMSEFWRDIPASLGVVENLCRTLVVGLPFFMPLDLATAGQRRGVVIFALGTVAYFASWLVLIAAPSSSWSTSAFGFMAPAYTPALWLLGLGLVGRRMFWGHRYRPWMYFLISGCFLVAHIWHTALVYGRSR